MRGTAAAVLGLAVALPHGRLAAANVAADAGAGVAAAPAAAAPASAPGTADLARLTLRELVLEQATPLARRGYVFRTYWLDQYFRAQPWYRATGFEARALPADERTRGDAAERFRTSLPRAELERREAALRANKRSARARCPQSVTAGGAPGGARRVLAQDFGGLEIWDVGAGTSVRVPTNTRGFVDRPTPALTRDGGRALAVEASGDFGRVVSAWDAASGRSLGKPVLQTWDQSTIYVLAGDGATALVEKLDHPRVWSLWAPDEGRALLSLPADPLYTAAEEVAVSVDRRRVLALAGGKAWLWRAKAAAGAGATAPVQADAPMQLTEDYDTIDDVDLSPDGRWAAVAGSSSSGLRLFDADRPGKPRVLAASIGSVTFVSFSPDGRMVMAGTRGHALALWELPSGRLAWSQPAHHPSLDCARRWAAFLPGGGEVAMIDDAGGLEVLDLRTHAKRAVGAAGAIADGEADEIEEALLARALGNTDGSNQLRELSFEDQPDLLAQPLDEDDLLRDGKQGNDLHDIEALIYARRGRVFASPRWRGFAAKQGWYHADPKYGPARLTAVDRANLALLTKTERKLHPRPPSGRPDKAASVPRSAFPGCPAGAARRQSTDEDGIETIRCLKTTPAGEVADGPWWTWLPTGRLRETRVFAGDKQEGPFVTWFWSGVRKQEGGIANGKLQGRVRTYHPNGKVADESTFEAGELHGPRRRLFPNGKPALDASYEHGVPVGPWTAYYDNGRRAVTVTYPATASRPASQSPASPPPSPPPLEGWLPDGKPWPRARKVDIRTGQPAHASPLERLDMESLPPLIPAPCPEAGTPPPDVRKRLLAAARKAWLDDDRLPRDCVTAVGITCAPDLDGVPGAEVLASIDYRILINSQTDCHTKESNDAWEMSARVALSPPGPGRTAWTARGFVGYSRMEADNGGGRTFVAGFVRLPSGEAAIHAKDELDGGDCDNDEGESVLVLRDQRWATATHRIIVDCDHPEEPEQWDVF